MWKWYPGIGRWSVVLVALLATALSGCGLLNSTGDAEDDGGEGGGESYCDIYDCPAPEGLVVAEGVEIVEVQWEEVEGAVGYVVEVDGEEWDELESGETGVVVDDVDAPSLEVWEAVDASWTSTEGAGFELALAPQWAEEVEGAEVRGEAFEVRVTALFGDDRARGESWSDGGRGGVHRGELWRWAR